MLQGKLILRLSLSIIVKIKLLIKLYLNGHQTVNLISKLNNGNIWKGKIIDWWDENAGIRKSSVSYADGKKMESIKVGIKITT